jgi:cell division protein ZapA
MSAKKNAEVIIGGRVYTLSGYEEEDYLQRVATYINGKLNDLQEMDSFKRLSQDTKATLLELNIADDYFKARDRVMSMEAEMKQKDQEIYNLKHELVSLQVKDNEMENQLRDLEDENRDLKLTKSKLEASLEDALLGGIGTGDQK